MKNNALRTLVAGASLTLGLTQAASAGLLQIHTNGGSLGGGLAIGNTHDVAESRGTYGWYNVNLYSTAASYLTFEYLGYEAGWANSFLVAGQRVFWNRTWGGNDASNPGDKATTSAAADSLVDFGLDVNSGANAGYGVDNGNNVDPYTPNPDNDEGKPNFFVGYADAEQNSAYIGFDDGGGPVSSDARWDDNDYDDMVVKVTASVAEPSSVALLAVGLVGLGVARRRSES